MAPIDTPADVRSAFPPLCRVQVKLGFLQTGGIYVAELLTLEQAPDTASAAAAAPAATTEQQQQQLEVRGLSASNLSVSLEAQRRVVLRLWAEREGPYEASFALALPPGGNEVEVRVTATVFDRKKGCPALKPHVHCVGFSAETDTEAVSDWQGF